MVSAILLQLQLLQVKHINDVTKRLLTYNFFIIQLLEGH